jgi:GWxTD domain-containing protein
MRGKPPFRAAALAAAALSFATILLAQGARAQEKRDLVLAADSMIGAGDSAGARRALDQAVEDQPNDAAAWHARGLYAWHTARAEDRIGFMKRVANDTLLMIADSSLKEAVRLRPDHPNYLIDLGRYDLTSNSANVRGHASGLFKRALMLATKLGDSVQIASAQDEVGLTWWRSYVDRADRHIYSYVIKNVKDRTFLKDPRSISYFIDNETIRASSQDWSGQLEYIKASEAFAAANAYDPENERAFRHTEMLLADRKRWMEVEHNARLRLSAHPADPWAWMAAGMSAHRLHDAPGAAAAFDSALKYMSPEMHHRFDRLDRIVTPRDSAMIARLPDADRKEDAEMYWLLVDPLWATPDNEHRLEFLSRVVFAELRFSVEEFNIHGADTDRGEVYVRYGPPPAVISFPMSPQQTGNERAYLLWWYSQDEAFLFRQLPTYGVSTLEPDDLRELHRLRDTIPVVFTNAGERPLVDSIAVQLVRFRAGSDSGDVFVAAALPVERMIEGVDLARGAVDISIRAYTWRGTPVFTRDIHEMVDFMHADPVEVRAWRTRLHAGSFLYRVEALQPDARRGARAASRIEVVGESGFGLSDLLIADQVTSRTGSGGARWSDFLIAPNMGFVKRGHPFALLWETYGLTPQKGSNKYKVSITVQRVRAGGFGGFVAKIVGGISGAVGLSASGDDKVSLSFPREVPAAEVNVDYVSIDLGEAPAGTYLVTVDVTDTVTNATTRQVSSLTVLE